MPKKILVVGSSNIDLILRIPRFHLPGETITGENLVTAFGGKGANQAVAARRLGGSVRFVTKMGDDHHGKIYRNYLVENGFSQKDILRDKKHPTGVAVIELDPKGENRIIVSPGANGCLTGKDAARLKHPWEGVGVLVTQLEIPLSTVQTSLRMARDRGAVTLLNPSPAVRVPPGLISLVDFLVPNEWEAQALTGMRLRRAHDLPKVAKKLLATGTKNVVITLGRRGLFFKNNETELHMQAFKVKSVDSTSAGDAFMGGLACGLSEDMPVDTALRFASAAGALATTKLGAQPSLPTRAEVDSLLQKIEFSPRRR